MNLVAILKTVEFHGLLIQTKRGRTCRLQEEKIKVRNNLQLRSAVLLKNMTTDDGKALDCDCSVRRLVVNDSMKFVAKTAVSLTMTISRAQLVPNLCNFALIAMLL